MGSRLVVQTAYGAVRGKHLDSASDAWLGVPYAAPPIGARRFRRPERPEPWSGELGVTAYGNACAQNADGMASALGAGLSEDCLYLNIHSPAADDAKRPVLVWIHGGAFLSGSGATYDGALLAESGDIVVVTINYRMGAFGFVNLRSVVGDSVDDNIGILDQIQALRWVQENIAAFGGDPTKVTVAGESAGSVSIALLMVCAQATPYFQQAIMQSGTFSLTDGPIVSEELAAHYAADLGLGPGDVDKLNALSTADLVASQKRVSSKLKGMVSAAPWFDGSLLPESLEAARATPTPQIPLLAGANRDEITLFSKLPGDILPTKRAVLEALLRKQFGDSRADTILATYPQKRWATTALGSDFAFVMPTAHFALRHSEHSPTWFYRFDYSNLILGATHGLELVFLWDFKGVLSLVARGPMTNTKRALGTRMQRAWISFVRDGDPGSEWPDFSAPELRTKIWDKNDRVLNNPFGPRYAAWAGLDASTVPEPAIRPAS